MDNKTLEAAASAAGMSERAARKWQRGPLPSATKEPRTWRTRPDPFVEVWSTEIEPLLVADKEGRLEAKTIFAELCRTKPGVFEPGQLRKSGGWSGYGGRRSCRRARPSRRSTRRGAADGAAQGAGAVAG